MFVDAVLTARFSLSFATAGMLVWLLTKGAGKKKLPKVKRWT